MPVYIRHGDLQIPTPSDSSVDIDDQDAFLLDPELVIDELPQPYRTLDKLLDQILDEAWEIISQRKRQREEEAEIIRPPLCGPTSAIEKFSKKSAMCHSRDGRYVFVAFQTRCLSAFDADTHELISDWSDDEINACFESVTSSVIGQNIHLLATVDDMGFARLFVFVSNSFYLIQLLNEQQEGVAKSNASKCDLSASGDFCALSLECDGNSWLEVYKIPRDNWLREIEVAQKELSKRVQAASDMSVAADAPVDIGPENPDLLEIKFSAIAIVLKAKPPSPTTGNASISHQDAFEKAGLPGTVGNGFSHLLTNQHLGLRRSAAAKEYADRLKDYDVEIEKVNIPSWHYLYSARMQSEITSSNAGVEDMPISICVWWKNSYLMQTYQLATKSAKDLELKPDLIWPMSSNVACSSASECTNILAFGHENGFVTVIDRHLCRSRSAIFAGDHVPVASICILPGDRDQSKALRNTPPVCCLISLSDGSVVFLDCSTDTLTVLVQPSCAYSSAFIKPISTLTQIFLHSVEPGKTFLRNLISGNIICQLLLSDSLENPKDRINFSTDNSLILVRNDDESVDLFDLREFRVLDEHRSLAADKSSFALKETIESRCRRFFSQRILQQALRVEQLESSWNMMAKELKVIMGFSRTDSFVSKPSLKKFSDQVNTTQSVIIQ